MRGFKPYPAYKDSGVEWLGAIPAHWGVKRLKTVATVELSNVDKKSVEGQEAVRLCNYTDVYYNERITSDLEFMATTATPEQARRFSLRAGDVLITKDSESWTDIAVPAVVAEDMPGVLCGYHLAHVRPGNDCDGAFLSRAFAAIGPRDQFQVAANGITRFGLGGDAIRTGLFALPSLPEQRAIAGFLDRETARIDALVAKKERLIALLEEQRTALISHAVTKGLDPTAPMKDSGVEWLGRIPAHWEVKPLKFSVTMNPDVLDEATRPDYEMLYVDVGNVDSTGTIQNAESLRFENAPTRARRKIRAGDTILSTVRTYLKAIAFVPDPPDNLIVSTGFAVLRPGRNVAPKFLWRLVQSQQFVDAVVSYSEGVGYPAINPSRLGRLVAWLPPLPEQRAIAAFLDRETAKIDALIAKVREAIERLKEYRTALISAAVTGKIDVRELGRENLQEVRP